MQVSSQQTTVGASKPTVGALDMGGASTQVSFESRDSDEDSEEDILLYGNTYDVYSHSYLCYGFDEANRKYKALLVQVCSVKRFHVFVCAILCSPMKELSTNLMIILLRTADLHFEMMKTCMFASVFQTRIRIQ